MPNVWCTESAPDEVEILISKLSQTSAVHKLGSLKNWSGSKVSYCEIVDSVPISVGLMFSLHAE